MSFRGRIISSLTSGRISGVDTFAIRLTEGLKSRGWDAKIILTHPDKVEQDNLPLPEGLSFDTLPKEWRTKRRYRRRALRDYLLANSPCIYIPNYDYDHSPVSAYLPDDIMTVGILHSDDAMHYDHVAQLGRFWNAIVAVSQKIATTTGALGLVSDRLHTIPYGVEFDEAFSKTARDPHSPLQILYVGRIEKSQKRIMDMPKILDRLAEKNVPVVVTLVGDGPARAELETAAQSHLSSGRLRLLGTRPSGEMPDLYRAADVFILTSAFEGLPVSLLEALSFGCVPVVTLVESGIPELIHEGENGFLVPIGDVNTFAARIEQLARDRALLNRLSAAAHATIKVGEHSVERMVQRYEELFLRVLEDRGQGTFRRPDPYFAELAVRHWQCRIRRNIRRLTGRSGY